MRREMYRESARKNATAEQETLREGIPEKPVENLKLARADTEQSVESHQYDHSMISRNSVLKLIENNESVSVRSDLKDEMSAKFSAKFDYSYEQRKADLQHSPLNKMKK